MSPSPSSPPPSAGWSMPFTNRCITDETPPQNCRPTGNPPDFTGAGELHLALLRPAYIVHNKVWKKGDAYIVQIPISYAPTRESVIMHGRGWQNMPNQWVWPASRSTAAEATAYPVEYYYALMNEQQYHRLTIRLKRITREHDRPFYRVPILSAAEIDLRGAELLLDSESHQNKGLRPPAAGILARRRTAARPPGMVQLPPHAAQLGG